MLTDHEVRLWNRTKDKRMVGKRGVTEDVYVAVLQRLNDRAKTGLFEPQYPGVEAHTRRQHI